jgi:hypothetical protein
MRLVRENSVGICVPRPAIFPLAPFEQRNVPDARHVHFMLMLTNKTVNNNQLVAAAILSWTYLTVQ